MPSGVSGVNGKSAQLLALEGCSGEAEVWNERQTIVVNRLLAMWKNSLHARKIHHVPLIRTVHFTCGVTGVLAVAHAMEQSVAPEALQITAKAMVRIVKATLRRRRRATQARMNLLQQVVAMATIPKKHAF